MIRMATIRNECKYLHLLFMGQKNFKHHTYPRTRLRTKIDEYYFLKFIKYMIFSHTCRFPFQVLSHQHSLIYEAYHLVSFGLRGYMNYQGFYPVFYLEPCFHLVESLVLFLEFSNSFLTLAPTNRTYSSLL